MGQVYFARSPGGRAVAVKVIRPDLAAEPGFRARFAREVAAAKAVSGLFTAPIVDADPEGVQPWLATAYVPGPSLAAAVAEWGRLPPHQVLNLAAGLAEGIKAIHAAGLVHRDLKPSNVLLAEDGPRVIDFGISRASDSSMLTQAGTVMGSPGFLSPEQAEGREVGAPSDMFSLGAVLAFAARGEGPFGTGPAAALIYRVVNAAPDLSALPEQLRPLIAQCLAKDPASRPTAAEFLASLGVGQLAPGWPAVPLAAGPPAGAGERHDRTLTSMAPSPAVARHATPATPAAYAGPGWAGAVTPPLPGNPRPGNGNRGRLTLIAVAVAVVIAAASTGTALALSGRGSPAPATATLNPGTARHASAKSTHGPVAPSTPARASAPAKATAAPPPVIGVWDGTYACNQGQTGMQLTITSAGGNSLKARFDFFATASNPTVPNGSFELTGSYSATGGLVLNPAYWIQQPPNYLMVGVSAPPSAGNSMHGTVQGLNCTTFSVTR